MQEWYLGWGEVFQECPHREMFHCTISLCPYMTYYPFEVFRTIFYFSNSNFFLFSGERILSAAPDLRAPGCH